jgi:ribonuclease R
MQQAVYSPDNVGHFGLAYEAYAHFTSPIRRYPDLLIHRAIKAVLNGDKYKAGDWNELGEHCSMTERRADDATRDVTNWLKCFYMQDRIGEEFEGTVAGVTSFGLFVALDGVYVEGLLHVTELGNDYFHYDKARHEMAGERTGVRYRLGDRLSVKLVRVDLETTKIDFTLVNKNNELESKPKVESGKNSAPVKTSVKSQTAVKSTPKFEGGKSDAAFGRKPVSRSAKGPAGMASTKPKSTIKSGSASKSGSETKPVKSKKVAKKTTKRKVKK